MACGVFGWTPNIFWAATPHECLAAYEGYCEAHGIDTTPPITRDRLEELMEMYPD